MKKQLLSLVLAFAFVIGYWAFNVGDCFAAIPQKINYQGKLTDASGKLVSDGNYDFVFSIYDAESGGNQEWTETWDSGTSQVTVTNGLFNVIMGTHTAIDLGFDKNYWLEVAVEGETLSPRQQIVSAE